MDDSIEIAAPPAPTPCASPHELKDRMLDDYTRKAGTYGLPSEPAAIERLVMHDLALADNFKRDEGPLPEARAPSTDEVMRNRERARRAAEESTRAQLVDTKPTEWGPRLDLPPEFGNSERWRLAKGRMVRVMEGASLPIRHPDGSFDFRSMTATCGYPDGAYEFLSNWFALDLRYAWQTRAHNRYYGMSHRDASLKFAADAMDICDRSSGRFGPWFVPK